MGTEQQGGPVAMTEDFGEANPESAARDWVETGGGLVKDEDFGPSGNRSCEGH